MQGKVRLLVEKEYTLEQIRQADPFSVPAYKHCPETHALYRTPDMRWKVAQEYNDLHRVLRRVKLPELTSYFLRGLNCLIKWTKAHSHVRRICGEVSR